jgi:hypothetical protein
MKKTVFALVASIVALQSAASFACVKWKSTCTRVEDGVCMEWTSVCEDPKEGKTVEKKGEQTQAFRSASPAIMPFIFSQLPSNAREVEVIIDEETGAQQVNVLK